MSAILNQQLRPLEKYFRRSGVTDICINRPGEVWLDTYDGWKLEKDKEITKQTLRDLATNIATIQNQKFSDSVPVLGTAIPGHGFRIHVLSDTLCKDGISYSIRISQARSVDLNSYFASKEAKKIDDLIKDGKALVIAGGTSSGKTTLLNSLVRCIPENARIITIQDADELQIPQKNVVNILKSKTGTDIAQTTYQTVVDSIVRMRPDRVLWGELDINNTMPFLRIVNTGHAGSMATIHANGFQEVFDAICMNAQLAGVQGAKEVIEQYAKKAIDAIIFAECKRDSKGLKKFTARLEILK